MSKARSRETGGANQRRDGSLLGGTGGTLDSVAHGRAISLLPPSGLRCKFVKPVTKKHGFAFDFVRRDAVQLVKCLDNDYRSSDPFRRSRYRISKRRDDDFLVGVDYLSGIAD